MEIFRPKGMTMLDIEIERLVKTLSNLEPSEEEYETVAKNLQKLTEARERKNDRTISNDTLVAVTVNIITMLLILNYEKTGVITTKAFNLFGRKTL